MAKEEMIVVKWKDSLPTFGFQLFHTHSQVLGLVDC